MLCRLQEAKKAENPSIEFTQPEIQVSSVLEMATLFASGGFEGRAIEFFPSMTAIEEAQKMFK